MEKKMEMKWKLGLYRQLQQIKLTCMPGSACSQTYRYCNSSSRKDMHALSFACIACAATNLREICITSNLKPETLQVGIS